MAGCLYLARHWRSCPCQRQHISPWRHDLRPCVPTNWEYMVEPASVSHTAAKTCCRSRFAVGKRSTSVFDATGSDHRTGFLNQTPGVPEDSTAHHLMHHTTFDQDTQVCSSTGVPLSLPGLPLEGNPALSLFVLLQRQSFLFASVASTLTPCLPIEQPRTQFDAVPSRASKGFQRLSIGSDGREGSAKIGGRYRGVLALQIWEDKDSAVT